MSKLPIDSLIRSPTVFICFPEVLTSAAVVITIYATGYAAFPWAGMSSSIASKMEMW